MMKFQILVTILVYVGRVFMILVTLPWTLVDSNGYLEFNVEDLALTSL
jgi:hypothetical protein